MVGQQFFVSAMVGFILSGAFGGANAYSVTSRSLVHSSRFQQLYEEILEILNETQLYIDQFDRLLHGSWPRHRHKSWKRWLSIPSNL